MRPQRSQSFWDLSQSRGCRGRRCPPWRWWRAQHIPCWQPVVWMVKNTNCSLMLEIPYWGELLFVGYSIFDEQRNIEIFETLTPPNLVAKSAPHAPCNIYPFLSFLENLHKIMGFWWTIDTIITFLWKWKWWEDWIELIDILWKLTSTLVGRKQSTKNVIVTTFLSPSEPSRPSLLTITITKPGQLWCCPVLVWPSLKVCWKKLQLFLTSLWGWLYFLLLETLFLFTNVLPPTSLAPWPWTRVDD